MKDFIEGLLLCIGVGLFYLAADTNDSGHTGWALWLFVAGAFFLLLFMLITIHHTELKSDLRRIK